MFDKYFNYAFVALDFDRTVVSGHMHQYFMTLYPDKSPQEIVEMYNNKSMAGFKDLLREIAIFTYLNDELDFVKNLRHPDRKELCDIFRSKRVLEKLKTKYNKDFSEFQPFMAERELKNFLEYRIQNNLPTAIVSNSMFPEMIRETLFVLIEEPNSIKVYTPNCDKSKTIRNNIINKSYIPHEDKNILLRTAKTDSVVIQGLSMFMDDESKNCVRARDLGFETEDTPPMYNPYYQSLDYDSDVTGSRSPSPVSEFCVTPPATIGGMTRAASSTTLFAGQIVGANVCPSYSDDTVETLADKLDKIVTAQDRNDFGRN